MAPRKTIPGSQDLYSDLFDKSGELKSNKALAERHQNVVDAFSKATLDGERGATYFDGEGVAGTPMVKSRSKVASELRDAATRAGFAKSAGLFNTSDSSRGAGAMMKEWTTVNPVSTGLVPYDLEQPAKLLAPRPTPLRNAVPRLKGQGSARRVKVVSGFTGSGTGGMTTTQPGITESTTNAGPGGLSYIRPPYIQYAGFDLTFNYVTWGLSDSVSWQAEYEGTGFQDIRSLSNVALLYSTMLNIGHAA